MTKPCFTKLAALLGLMLAAPLPAAAVDAVLDRFPGCSTAKVKVAEAGQRLADEDVGQDRRTHPRARG